MFKEETKQKIAIAIFILFIPTAVWLMISGAKMGYYLTGIAIIIVSLWQIWDCLKELKEIKNGNHR